MVLAPLVIIDRRRITGVIAVRIRHAGQLGQGIIGRGIVTVRVPVQTLGCPVKNPIECHPWRGGGGEQQRSREIRIIGVRAAENQVAVASQDADVVAVLVKRMLPASLADNAYQR